MGAIRNGVVAVTGASGLLGSHICARLLDRGFTVRAVVRDKNNQEKTAHLTKLAEGKSGKLEFFSGDLSVPKSYDEAFAGADAIVHAAAVVEVENAKDPKKEVVDPSVEGTRNVLDSVERVGQNLKRFVQLSSVAAVQNFNQPADHVFTEEDWNDWGTVENGDAYGLAKTQAERLVWETSKGKHWDCVSINPTVVFGECYTKAHTKASTVILRQIIYGNPTLAFNCTYVYAGDVAQAHVEAITREEAGGNRFLLVGNEPCTNTLQLADIAKKLFPQYKMDTRPQYPPMVMSMLQMLGGLPVVGGYIMTPFQLMMTTRSVDLSNEKMKSVLRIQPVSLEECVKRTISSMIDTGFVKPRPA